MTTTTPNRDETKPSSPMKKRKGAVARKRRSTARTGKIARSNGGMQTTAVEFLKQGRSVLSGAYDQVSHATQSLPHAARYVTDPRKRRSITRMMEERPLMVGAVGLGIGMVLAALLPSFSTPHEDSRPGRRRRM
jgi:hypothetical protein